MTGFFCLLSAFPTAIMLTFWLYLRGVVRERLSFLTTLIIGIVAFIWTRFLRLIILYLWGSNGIDIHVAIGTSLIFLILIGSIIVITTTESEDDFSSVGWSILFAVIALFLLVFSENNPEKAELVGIIGAITGAFFGCWFSRSAISSRNKRFNWLWKLYIRFVTYGGTNFRGANMNFANMNFAKLRGANFKDAKIIGTSWKDAKFLEFIRSGNNYLKYQAVRQLLSKDRTNGQEEFNGLNLRGINLEGKLLQGTKFIGTNLSLAKLSNAHLEHTNLQGANLNGADLTNSFLTAACIQDWAIDDTTILDNVTCYYVYMEDKKDPLGGKRRDPQDPDNFEPGYFKKYVEKDRGVIAIPLRKEYNREALIAAFQELAEDKHYMIQGFDMVGDDAIIKIRFCNNINSGGAKDKFYQTFRRKEEDIKKVGSINSELQNMPMNEFVLKLLEIVKDMGGDNITINNSNGIQFKQSNTGAVYQFNNIDMSQDLTLAASQIQDSLDQLKKFGVTDDDAQEKVAKYLANQAKENSGLKSNLQQWVKLIRDTTAKTSISEAVKGVIKSAWNLLSF